MDDALPPIAGNHQNAPISRLIAEVVERCPGERITLGEMAEAFGDRPHRHGLVAVFGEGLECGLQQYRVIVNGRATPGPLRVSNRHVPKFRLCDYGPACRSPPHAA